MTAARLSSMIQQPTPPAPAKAGTGLKIVQPAEMVGVQGIKAVALINGVIIITMTPETAAEAQQFNAALNSLT